MDTGQEQNFGRHLRRLRLVKKLSQREVAATIGVSSRAVHDFEAGRYRPRTRIWLKLRDLLGKELPEP